MYRGLVWLLISLSTGNHSFVPFVLINKQINEPYFVYQVDVSGNCSTELKIIRESDEGDKEILKIKNLSQCTNRTHNITKLNPVPYNVNSVSIQSP